MAVDPGDDSAAEDPQSWNKYTYVRNNPINSTDPTGKYTGIDDAVFSGGGAVVGLATQALTDVFSGHLSGLEDYAAAGLGGAAAGETLLYAGPVAAGAVGGAATNLLKQGFKNMSGKQDGFDATSLATDTAVGGALGLIPGSKVAGVTEGAGSFKAIFNQMVTKAENGTISSMTAQTAGKMAVGRAVDAAVGQGAVVAAAAGASGAMPSSEARRPASGGGRSGSPSKVDAKIQAMRGRAAQGPQKKK